MIVTPKQREVLAILPTEVWLPCVVDYRAMRQCWKRKWVRRKRERVGVRRYVYQRTPAGTVALEAARAGS